MYKNILPPVYNINHNLYTLNFYPLFKEKIDPPRVVIFIIIFVYIFPAFSFLVSPISSSVITTFISGV